MKRPFPATVWREGYWYVSQSLENIVIVRKKGDIPVGTLRSILNQPHIDPDDWNKLT